MGKFKIKAVLVCYTETEEEVEAIELAIKLMALSLTAGGATGGSIDVRAFERQDAPRSVARPVDKNAN
jgi:hypothetical protein